MVYRGGVVMKYRIHFLKFSAIAASACLLTGAVVQTSAAAAVVPTVVASAPKDQVSAVLPVESMVSSRIIAVLDAI